MGQCLKVYTDHKNLVHEASGLSSDRVYRWRVLLEEYNPEIVYIKGIANTVADALSRLEYCPKKNVKDMRYTERFQGIVTLFTHYMQQHGGKLEVSDPNCDQYGTNTIDVNSHEIMSENALFNDVFANMAEEEEIYPPTVREIAEEQRRSAKYKGYFKSKRPKACNNKRISLVLVDDIEILVHDKSKYIVPGSDLQSM